MVTLTVRYHRDLWASTLFALSSPAFAMSEPEPTLIFYGKPQPVTGFSFSKERWARLDSSTSFSFFVLSRYKKHDSLQDLNCSTKVHRNEQIHLSQFPASLRCALIQGQEIIWKHLLHNFSFSVCTTFSGGIRKSHVQGVRTSYSIFNMLTTESL